MATTIGANAEALPSDKTTRDFIDREHAITSRISAIISQVGIEKNRSAGASNLIEGVFPGTNVRIGQTSRDRDGKPEVVRN